MHLCLFVQNYVQNMRMLRKDGIISVPTLSFRSKWAMSEIIIRFLATAYTLCKVVLGPYTGTYCLYWNGTYWFAILERDLLLFPYWNGTYYFLIGDCWQLSILERDLLLFDRFLLTIQYTGTGPTTFLIGCVGIFCLFVPRSILEWDLLLFDIYADILDSSPI